MGISNQRTGADRIQHATCLQDLVEISRVSRTSVLKALEELSVDCDGGYPAFYSMRVQGE